MFFLLFYIIILFTKQSNATSNSPGSSSSASGSSGGTYVDYYGGVSSTSGNAAPTSSSGALSSDLLSSLKLDHQFTQSTPSDSYDQVYPAILKKYTKSTDKCQPKIIIRHKIKEIHVPYPVEKKVPVYKEVKIPIKVPVKVPVYIPVKYTEEKITSYQPIDNKYDDGQQAPNSQLEFDDPSPGPYQDVSYEYQKSQPQNPPSPKYQLNFGSYQDPAPDPPPTKFVKISPSISNKFSEVSYDGQQQQQYTPEPEVHPKIPYNYGFPKLPSQSNPQPPPPPSKYQFEYSPPIPMPQPTAPVAPSSFGFKNLDALLASKLSALSGGNQFGGNQGMQQSYSMDPSIYSPQDYYPSASMTYSMKKHNRKSKSSDPAQMDPQAMDPNTAYNMFGFGSVDSDTSYLDSTLFTGTGLDRTSDGKKDVLK